ncbi:MAG: hypothetical protein JW704_12945 [Anaerolineaceae bacterium]|nr:hypothetical protein [Anaerolineaceae bacterium]
MTAVIFDILMAIVGWIFTIHKIQAVRLRHDRPVFCTWLFALLFAIGTTLRITYVHAAVDALVGIPNIAWLMSYTLLSAAMYAVASGCYAMVQSKDSWWLKPGLATVLSALAIIYLLGIANTPSHPDYSIPRNISEVLFMSFFYAYLALTLKVVVTTSTHLSRHEENPRHRFRWQLLASACWAGIIFCISRTVFVTLMHFCPHLPGLHVIGLIESISVIISALLWPLYAVSNKIYAVSSSVSKFVAQAITLHNLDLVQGRIARFYPKLKKSTPAYWKCLLDLDFRIYQTVISILDGHVSLKRCLLLAEEGADDLATPFWYDDSQLHAEVWHLLRTLDKAILDVPYEDLVEFLGNRKNLSELLPNLEINPR